MKYRIISNTQKLKSVTAFVASDMWQVESHLKCNRHRLHLKIDHSHCIFLIQIGWLSLAKWLHPRKAPNQPDSKFVKCFLVFLSLFSWPLEGATNTTHWRAIIHDLLTFLLTTATHFFHLVTFQIQSAEWWIGSSWMERRQHKDSSHVEDPIYSISEGSKPIWTIRRGLRPFTGMKVRMNWNKD